MIRKRKKKQAPKGKNRKDGVVYVVRVELDDEVLYKVGATQYSAVKRVLQIIEHITTVYGYFPKCKIVKQERCKNYYQVEKVIHKELEAYGYEYNCKKKWNGSTEVFKCELAILLEVYQKVISADEPAEDNLYEW